MDKSVFNEELQALIVSKKDKVLLIPNSKQTQHIKTQLSKTHLAMNIPTFKLRIIQDTEELYNFPVREGESERDIWLSYKEA